LSHYLRRGELLEIPPNVRGVLVLSIDDDSAFVESGIRPGDVIESINQQPVTSPAETKARLREALASARKNVLMLINRNGTNRYLAVSFEIKPSGQAKSSRTGRRNQAERAGRELNGWQRKKMAGRTGKNRIGG
jgi:S1-C subfamily serine protease